MSSSQINEFVRIMSQLDSVCEDDVDYEADNLYQQFIDMYSTEKFDSTVSSKVKQSETIRDGQTELSPVLFNEVPLCTDGLTSFDRHEKPVETDFYIKFKQLASEYARDWIKTVYATNKQKILQLNEIKDETTTTFGQEESESFRDTDTLLFTDSKETNASVDTRDSKLQLVTMTNEKTPQVKNEFNKREESESFKDTNMSLLTDSKENCVDRSKQLFSTTTENTTPDKNDHELKNVKNESVKDTNIILLTESKETKASVDSQNKYAQVVSILNERTSHEDDSGNIEKEESESFTNTDTLLLTKSRGKRVEFETNDWKIVNPDLEA